MKLKSGMENTTSKRPNVYELGEKCKNFEKNFSLEQAIAELPLILRLDGNNFSAWTKSLEKPFDGRFADVMEALTIKLINETGSDLGFHQSDEITLISFPKKGRQYYHNGKKQKILSKLTSKASVWFNELVEEHIGGKKVGIFDCRMYQVPTKEDAMEQIVWRQLDGIRNSKQMFSHNHLGHKAIENKSTKTMIEMVKEKLGFEWEDLEERFRNGSLFRRMRISSPFTPEEISKLPKEHHYFRNPDMVIEREKCERMNILPLYYTSDPYKQIFNESIDMYMFTHYLERIESNYQSLTISLANYMHLVELGNNYSKVEYSLLYDLQLIKEGIEQMSDKYTNVVYDERPFISCGPTITWANFQKKTYDEKIKWYKDHLMLIKNFIDGNFIPYFKH